MSSQEDISSHEDFCPVCILDFPEEGFPFWKKKGLIVLISSGILLFIGLIIDFFLKEEFLALLFFFSVALISGHEIVIKGITSLFKGHITINFLMTLASIGAFLIGHPEEGAAVLFLFYGAEFLEEYAAEKQKKSTESLLKLAPETATLKKDGKELSVHVHDVNPRDIIVVRPGEKIPLDGIIIEGHSSINQAPITGESVPVTKTVGDEVYAGTLNCEGFLEVSVSKKSDETMLSKISKLINEAQMRKAPAERFIEKFSKYYTPLVILFAFFVATIPVLFFDKDFKDWFYKALILLVVSCPCALAISIPVSIVSGITNGAKNGVLIKGGSYVEELSKIKVFALDKTGTLTEGKLELTDVITLNDSFSKEEILKIAASIETFSEHPIGKAIVEYAEEKGIKPVSVSDFKALLGRGIMGEIDRKFYYIGSKTLFKEVFIDFQEKPIETLENQGKTVFLIGTEKGVLGAIAVADKIRKESITVIKELKKRGIKAVMITGDGEKTARAVAKKLDINEYYAELSPEKKVKIVEKLLDQYGHVAVVGDGVNDAPALAKASVGIAMGVAGSDIALETADVALMKDDLLKIPYLIDLSKKTVKVMKENVSLSISIKSAFVFLVFPGLVTLWMAVGIGDMGLSLAVILNAIRIQFISSI